MEFKKCSRCGNFFLSAGNICPKCTPKENYEFSAFKSYISENGLNNSVDEIAGKTGISAKNINRFIEYNNEINDEKNINNTLSNNTNSNSDNGITFLI